MQMLLLNSTLIRLSKGFRGWILMIAFLKLVVLIGITMFATSISYVLGALFHPEGTELKLQLLRALISSGIMLMGNLLIGEAEFRCSAKARKNIRTRIMEKVLELDVGDIDRLGPTRTINSAVDGVETMQGYYTRYLPGLIYGLVAPIFTFFVLRSRCLPAAVLLLCSAIIIVPLNNIFRSVVEKLKKDYWKDLNDLTSYYLDSINGLTTTELFGRSTDREKTMKRKAQKLSDTIISVMCNNFSSVCFNELLMNLATFAALAIVCVQLIQGKIGLVPALTVLMLSHGFFGSIRQIQWIAHEALIGIAAAQNVADILEIDSSMTTLEETDTHSFFSGIRLKDVDFSYTNRSEVLSEVNMDIPEGATVAIVGESGCGKSSIASLLLRFYDPKGGTITINGQDYRTIDPDRIRRQIIMVPQYVYIFSGSLRENLQMGNNHATDGELLEALEQVRLKKWVQEQPAGLDCSVGDAGARLSGGQRQKIGIARALLAQSEYIIFDEATSNVDPESEQEIWDCLKELSERKTLIIISHRLSTIRNADLIYVMESGHMVEKGSHDELMGHNSLYNHLVTEQNILESQGERRRQQ